MICILYTLQSTVPKGKQSNACLEGRLGWRWGIERENGKICGEKWILVKELMLEQCIPEMQ